MDKTNGISPDNLFVVSTYTGSEIGKLYFNKEDAVEAHKEYHEELITTHMKRCGKTKSDEQIQADIDILMQNVTVITLQSAIENICEEKYDCGFESGRMSEQN